VLVQKLGLVTPATPNQEFSVLSSQFLAQQFTLTTPIRISAIEVQMSGFGTDKFTLQVTNSIGSGTTQSNLLFTANSTFPSTNGPLVDQTVTFPADLVLFPGTYYILLSSSQTQLSQGWATANTILPSTVGTISNTFFFTSVSSTNSQFPPASGFFTYSPYFLGFQILGAPVLIPQL
jgi:hypothetical protein